MDKRNELCLLYRFTESLEGQGGSGPKYHMIYLFDDHGLLTQEDIQKLAGGEYSNFEGVFNSKEDLMKFSYELVSSKDYSTIYLLANNDFNIGIESCENIGDLRDIFHRYGSELVSEESKSKSLFGKIF